MRPLGIEPGTSFQVYRNKLFGGNKVDLGELHS